MINEMTYSFSIYFYLTFLMPLIFMVPMALFRHYVYD